MRDKKTPDEVMIKGLQIKMNPDKNIKEDVSNLISIKDLKLLYIEKLGESGNGLKIEMLRFFCMGKEL